VRVYHFTNMVHAISNLSLRRLKVSRISELNDPFELFAADLLNPKHLKAFSKFRDQLDKTKGFVCFSGAWRNPLLWGHYADKHQGIALGFDIPDDQAIKMHYTSHRAKVKFDTATRKIIDGPGVVDALIRTKFTDWKYEDEYRIYVNLDPETQEGGLHFVDFSKELQLHEVIIGMRCTLPMQRVHDLLRENVAPVRVKKAGMSRRNFKLIEDRSFRKSPIKK
jgi:hypothetical protein